MVARKVSQTKVHLGGDSGLMEEKRGIPSGFFHLGVHKIPTNTPKFAAFNGEELPNVAFSSMYNRHPIFPASLTANEKSVLENRQREAVNRRISQLTGSLQVTQMNTGKSGFKLKRGEPLARFSSGFDRDYVLWQLLTSYEIQPAWFGLQELDEETAYSYLAKLNTVKERKMSDRKKIKAWTAILKKIEFNKMQSLCPKDNVKA
jgi:hypothetical protein